MLTLGAPGLHNPTWTLVADGAPVVSVEEDRLHRVKNRFGLIGEDGQVNVLKGLAYILDTAGIGLGDLDSLAFGFNPSAIYHPQSFEIRRDTIRQERIFVEQSSLVGQLRRLGYKGPIDSVRHHLAHAAAAYFTSPFEESAIVTVDGWGEDETLTVCHARGPTIETLQALRFPQSIGEVFNQLTLRLGWGEDDAGKTMGLAAYAEGLVRPRDLIDFSGTSDESFSIDIRKAMEFVGTVPARKDPDPLTPEQTIGAAQIQAEVTMAMVRIAQWARQRTGSNNLCLGGGVALNCVANNAVVRQNIFQSVHVQPACGDSGIPMGAALAAQYRIAPDGSRHALIRPYLGRDYASSEHAVAIARHASRKYADEDELCRDVASLIVAGKIVGWFQGRAEFGPRALGNRSILGDPRDPNIRERLNKAIKRRESFRPFGPSVLLERAGEFFDLDVASPFMLLACPVRVSTVEKVPAIVHADGTTRPHTVSSETNPLFYRLISSFAEATGIPMLVNTSFNVSGGVVVESPGDAVDCFEASGLDALVIGQFLVTRETANPR